MNTVLRCVLALGALVALSGCSSSLVTGSPLVRPGEPLGSIQVINATGDQFHAVLISCSTSTYGLNRLPAAWRSPRAAPAVSPSRPVNGT